MTISNYRSPRGREVDLNGNRVSAVLNQFDETLEGVDDVRICGGCRWVKKPRRWVLRRLRDAAEAGLAPLLREVDALRRQRHWCSREGCWTHLLDEACSFWEPVDATKREEKPT